MNMPNVESRVGFRDVIRAREKSFARHNHYVDYGSEDFVQRGIWNYEVLLELAEGITLEDIIEEKVAEHPEGVNVLDIGCGKGAFLNNVRKRYPKVNTFGLSAYDYRGVWGSVRRFLRMDPLIDYRVGDAHKLVSIYPDARFDIVVSVAALEHFADPLVVVKQAYRLTKPGGVIMIGGLESLTMQEAEDLQAYWKSFGIKTKLGLRPVCFKKDDAIHSPLLIERSEAPRLPLPFKYVLSPKSPIFRAVHGIGYKLDREAVAARISAAA